MNLTVALVSPCICFFVCFSRNGIDDRRDWMILVVLIRMPYLLGPVGVGLLPSSAF